MATEYGIQLALNIITTDFGNLVAKVCECLLRRGTLMRTAIAKFTELPVPNVTKCLWVLIQHNCVQAFCLGEEGDFGESSSMNTQYMALFDNIIHRLRFPKFLSIVSKELDEKCVDLLEGLLQHGRLTLKQILDRAKGYHNEGGETVVEIYREKFIELSERRFVEHCPAPEPLVSLSNEEETPARKRGARSAQVAKKVLTVEERAVSAAKPMEAERFSLETVTGTGTGKGSRSGGLLNEKVGKKRKHSASIEDEHGILGGDKEPLWRVNFDEFKRCLRNKSCVEYAKARLDDGAGVVLNAMLETNKMMERTVSLSLDAIFQEVIQSNEGLITTLEQVREFLNQLGCESNTDDSYTLDVGGLIQQAQIEEIESIVLKRYGKEAYRLFRLFAKHDYPLEISKISADILVEQKETKKILFRLWKENFLHMEVAGRTLQAEILVWSVNKTLRIQVLDELYHAALNVRIRAAFEMDQNRELLLMDKDKRRTSKPYHKFKGAKLLLDSALSKLDDAIMLFHDFE